MMGRAFTHISLSLLLSAFILSYSSITVAEVQDTSIKKSSLISQSSKKKIKMIDKLLDYIQTPWVDVEKPKKTTPQDKTKANSPQGAVKRLISWIEKPWVDTKPVEGEGEKTGNVITTTVSGPSGGKGKAKGNKRIGFDDNATKNPAGSGKSKGDKGGKGSNPDIGVPWQDAPPKEVVSTGSDGSVAFSLWYPMCLFMDASVVNQSQGNATVKGLVDEAAACGVNLVVFPVTVRPGSYAMSAGAINAAQTASCNIPGNLDNATRASTSTCVASVKMADQMCGNPVPPNPPSVAGCASLQSGGDGNLTPEQKAKLEAHLGGSISFASSGSAAPSIEDIGACSAGTVGHEALGHSMWGHPNGAIDGNGIGITENDTELKPVMASYGVISPMLSFLNYFIKPARSWTGVGCAAMRGSAFPNKGRWKWDKNRKVYYVKQTKPEFQWNLGSGRKLFGGKGGKPPPLASEEPPGGGGGGELVGNDPRPDVSNDPPKDKTRPKQTPVQNELPKQTVINPGSGHKKKRQEALLSSIQEDLRPEVEDEPVRSDGFKGEPDIPPSAKGKGSARIAFDDNAKKANASGNSSGKSNRKSGSSKPGWAGEDVLSNMASANRSGPGDFATKRIGFDNNASKSNGVSGGGSSRIGFDNSRNKALSSGASLQRSKSNRTPETSQERRKVETASLGNWSSGGTTIIDSGYNGTFLEDDFFEKVETTSDKNRKDKLRELWRKRYIPGISPSKRKRMDRKRGK